MNLRLPRGRVLTVAVTRVSSPRRRTLIVAASRESAERIRVDKGLARGDVWCVTPDARTYYGYGSVPDEILIGPGWRKHGREVERLVETIRDKRPNIPVTVV